MSYLLFVLALACGNQDDNTLPQGDPVKGEELFTQSCSGCHGADGTGGYGGPYMLGLTEDSIADYIWNGNGNMPAFPDYSEQDVADIIAHIRELEENE